MMWRLIFFYCHQHTYLESEYKNRIKHNQIKVMLINIADKLDTKLLAIGQVIIRNQLTRNSNLKAT